MILAVLTGDDGSQTLVVGLHEQNIKRLLDDMPIRRDLAELEVPAFAGWNLVILGPEDVARFVARLAGGSG